MKYTVRYAHLAKINVAEGQSVNPEVPWEDASMIGIMGNTGISTAIHLHIDVIEGLSFKLWKLVDMYNGNKAPSKKQLDYFVSETDPTLFGVVPHITVEWDDQWYIDNRDKRHLAKDCVPINRKETSKNFNIWWNRKFAGRVLKTGYDNAYGNYVLIGYDTLDGSEWKRNVEDNSKSEYGQSKENAKIRYIKADPSNIKMNIENTTVDLTGYSGVNGTFFNPANMQPTSILIIGDVVYGKMNNDGIYQQNVLCYYDDDTFGIEGAVTYKEISTNIRWAVGGIGLIKDSQIIYNKWADGFIGAYSDVHRKTTQTSIGITEDNKVILVRHWNSDRQECAEHMKLLGCKYAIGLDGGGSTQYVVPDKNQSRKSTREVPHQILVTDLPI